RETGLEYRVLAFGSRGVQHDLADLAATAAFGDKQRIRAERTHAVGSFNRGVELHLGDLARLAVLANRDSEDLVRAQRVHEHRVAEHGDAVEHAARRAESSVRAGPHL